MRKSKKDIEFLERKKFLDIYDEFNSWLRMVGFRTANYKESSGHLNYHYSHYDKEVDSLHGVELYKHDILQISLYFLRDRHEHKFMFVGKMGSHSEVYTLERMKEEVLTFFRETRDSKLKDLEVLKQF